MQNRSMYTVLVALVVALGGFLLGFDSAVISGVVEPIREYFSLTDIQLGWSVSCLIFGAMAGNAVAGPLADRYGRKKILIATAVFFTVSAVASALARDFWFFIGARILGGIGVGGAILIAPIYIAEIAPPASRGRLVSFNQLNIVIGISAAFFSNYFLSLADLSWRWMLGVEAVPAMLYFAFLFAVPRSPRWLAIQGEDAEALGVLAKVGGEDFARESLQEIKDHLHAVQTEEKASVAALFTRRMSYIMLIAFGLAFFQQITGINAIFYYAPTIFGKAGAGADSALLQAVVIGLVNLGFTLVAMWLIDRLGRKPLLLIGSAVMATALFTNAWAFSAASYDLRESSLGSRQDELAIEIREALTPMVGAVFPNQAAFTRDMETRIRALASRLDEQTVEEHLGALEKHREDIAKEALVIDGWMVLLAIMAYIAAFAISLGPVMWAMLSEIFPTRLRGLAISAAGFFNSLVSFTVTFVFPWELTNLGPAVTFMIYGIFAAMTFLFTLLFVPETKKRSLEELESILVR